LLYSSSSVFQRSLQFTVSCLTCCLVLFVLLSFPTRRSSDLFSTAFSSATSAVIVKTSAFGATSKILLFVSSNESAFKSTSESLRSEEHTSELQSRFDLVFRLLLEKIN